MFSIKECEDAILELSRERDKTFIYLSALKRAIKEETIAFIRSGEIKICCATCKSRHGKIDDSGITHCDKYNELDEKYCIENNHRLWECE